MAHQCNDPARVGITRRVRVVLLALLLPFVHGGCATTKDPAASGTIAGQEVTARVDSEWARYYLEEYVQGEGRDSPTARSIEDTLATTGADPYDAESLQRLSEAFSTDVATLYFVSALYADPANRRMQDRYHAALDALSDPGGRSFDLAALSRYVVAFVPGYGYRRNPDTGADFARQRALLEEMGLEGTLIETGELGIVEENARIIAANIRELAGRGKEVIVVSASKGGPEVALALGELLEHDETSHIAAWISVGGILRGSPNADRMLRWPRRWVMRAMARFTEHPWALAENLSTATRGPVMDRLAFPPHLLIVHYVGAPLASQVVPATRDRYTRLRKLGPNDGLTLLADEITKDGIVVTEVGLDHYFRDPQIELKTLALARAVVKSIQGGE